MSPCYLLLAGDACPVSAGLAERLARRTHLTSVVSSPRMAALVNAGCACIEVGETGCILGSLFRRHGPAEPVTGLTASEAEAIAGGNGDVILRRFWGGYVAAIAGADRLRVLRDPSGTFPCYYAKAWGCWLFASDAALIADCGVPTAIDCTEVGRQLYRAFVPSPATALRDIRELLAGFALSLPQGTDRQQPCWSPWDHVGDADETLDEAASRLSRVIGHCNHAWASNRGRLLLSVSGGLDSSIIAACLARSGADTTCLTMFADDPAGDERPFARALCTDLGLPLIERAYRLEDIDIAEPLAAHLPRPRDRTQANAYERVHLEVASEIGADAFVTGNGGDHVLGYSQSAAPVADLYLTAGVGRDMVRSLSDVCSQTGCSIFDALRQAWQLAHGPRSHRVQPSPLFLDRTFVASLDRHELHHPWLDAPEDALPGKSAHISTILRVQPNLEASRGAYLPVLSPLMSQPVMEACLSVPSWHWRAGGQDRAAARRAFAGLLPPLILNRRIKGTPSRFAARLLDHFRGQIRERLLDGRLAANRIIDAAAIEQVLRGERPVPDLERVRILELVNAEAWLEAWAVRGSARDPDDASVKEVGRVRLPFASGPIP